MSGLLTRCLRQYADRLLLRVAECPGASRMHSYRGGDLLQAVDLVRRLNLPPDARVVLLLLPHSPELFLLQIGLVLGGKIPAVLPWPTTRVDGEKYQRNLLHQLGNLPADHLVTLPRLAENLESLLSFPVTGFPIGNHASFDGMFAARLRDAPTGVRPCASPPLPDDVLFLQFSGGTTGTQKCIVVTEKMLEEQISRLRGALHPADDACVVSWLPLYHDMGLIACLYFPLITGIPSVHFAASDWLLKPELLFQFIETYKGSLCWLPNFAFSYLAQRKDSMLGAYSLGHMRAWINCSEPVRERSFREFAGRFDSWGVPRESLQACYAMAENVFAVTQSAGSGPATVERSKVAGVASVDSPKAFELLDEVFVSSGRCLAGMSVRISAPDGACCPELETGEIQISSACIFGGYWSQDGFARASFTDDGWYRTGDLGFTQGEDLYVIGRIKDIIIVAGQNVFPEDVELIASQASGVQAGRVVAFGVDNDELGTQSIAVVAEMAGEFDAGRAGQIEQEVRRLLIASLGMAPRHVSIVPRRWVVKSTAGKISRRDTRSRFLAAERAGIA